ncbi:MAG: hypothetical protein ACYC8T_21325 [Myxococcaceae bacterium]
MKTSLATLRPYYYPSTPEAPSVIRSRRPSPILSLADRFDPHEDPLLDALAGNLGESWRSMGSPAIDVRAGAHELTGNLLARDEHSSLESLVQSGALTSELAKLPKGQRLVVTQKFSSMDEAKNKLGLSNPKTKTKSKEKKSFFEKAWNTIIREPKKKQPFWKKALGVVGASVAFSLFDYVGFNIARKHGKVGLYRPLQIATQAGLTFLLKEQFGWKTAGAFNALWWTFNDDLLYYGWAHLLNPGNGWDSRPAFKGITEDKVTWAWWTPVGLAKLLAGGKMGDPIKGKTLLVQAGVGAAIALTLLGLD